MKIEVAGTPL